MRIDNASIRRQLGCGPAGRHDVTQHTQTIVKPEPIKPELFIQWGMWMARENGVVRAATEQEIADFMGRIAV